MNIYETGLITMNKGKIIVLEGLDGCGKSTQLNILFNNLQSAGKTRLISFPNYESSTGRVVSEYLQGTIPCEGAPEPTQRRDFTLPTDMQATSPIGKTTTKTARLSCPDVIRHLMLYIR